MTSTVRLLSWPIRPDKKVLEIKFRSQHLIVGLGPLEAGAEVIITVSTLVNLLRVLKNILILTNR
jgi:hypothetical protein